MSQTALGNITTGDGLVFGNFSVTPVQSFKIQGSFPASTQASVVNLGTSVAHAFTLSPLTSLSYSTIIPTWAAGPDVLSTDIDISGMIQGTVLQNFIAVPYTQVALYYRVTNQLIYRTLTDRNGNFRFNNLQTGVNQYYVVALNEPNNALVYDLVSPVLATKV